MYSVQTVSEREIGEGREMYRRREHRKKTREGKEQRSSPFESNLTNS